MSMCEEETDKKIVENIECIYTILVKNRICKRKEAFFCYLCKSDIKTLLAAINHATGDKEHKQRNKMCAISHEEMSDLLLDEERCVELVFNGVVIVKLPELFCNLCFSELYSITSVTEHINDLQHVKVKRLLNLVSKSTSTLTSNNCDNINTSDNKTENSRVCDNESEEKTKSIDCSNSTSTLSFNNYNNNTNSSDNETENRVSHDNESEGNIVNMYSLPSTSYCNLSDKIVTNHYESNKIYEISEDEPITIYSCALCQINLTIKNGTDKYHKMFHMLKSYSLKNFDIVKFYFNSKDEKYIKCLVCNQEISDEIELQNHLHDVIHIIRMSILKKNSKIVNRYIKVDPLTYVYAEGCKDQSSLSGTVEATLLYCQICELKVPYTEKNVDEYKSHKKESGHQKNLQDFCEQKKDCTLMPISEYLPVVKCFLCDMEFDEESSLWLHYSSDSHLYLMTAIDLILQDKNIMFSFNTKNETTLNCKVCNATTYDLGSTICHIKGYKHEKNIEICSISEKINLSLNVYPHNDWIPVNPIPKPSEMKEDKVQMKKSEEKENNICYRCPICIVKSENNEHNMIVHLHSKKHKLTKNIYSSCLEDYEFFCPLCNIDFNDDVQFLNHLQANHKEEKYSATSQSSDNNIKSSNDEVNQNLSRYNLIDDSKVLDTLQAESVNSEKLDEMLYDLISFEPISESKPKLEQLEKNYSTIGSKDLSILGKEYISLCVEPGSENIFSVDLEKLRALQLSISLTFPTGSGRFCVPCSEAISDDSELFDKHLYGENHLHIIKLLQKKHRSTKKCIKDQITDLDRAKSYMQGVSADSVYSIQCFACNVKVEPYDSENHANLESHLRNTRLWKKSAEDLFEEKKMVFCEAWYYAEKFICDLCSSKFYSDKAFAEHLKKEEHLARVRHARHIRFNVEYNICRYCLTFWYGKTDGYLTHCEGDYHKYFVRTGFYAISQLPHAVKNVLNNHEKIIRELLELNEDSDKTSETLLLQSIQQIARIHYPCAETYMYGSRMSLTSLSESDLDVYVDCDGTYSSVMSSNSSHEYLRNIWSCLRNFKDTWIAEDILLCATVSIIRLRHRETNLKCDISCINGLSVEKSKLVRYYAEAYPACQKLILFLKKWMHLCRLSGPEGINSFATSFLVIYYLQIRGILPNVHSLIKLENNPNIVAGWETGSFKQSSLKISSETPEPLINIDYESTEILYPPIKAWLLGFFSFYSNFNYITDVICPFLGKIVKKEKFINIDLMPEEMENYKNLYQKGEAEIFKFDSPMCVQDPVNLDKNITKSVTKLKLRTFKQYCYESILLLNDKTINCFKE